MVQRCTNPAVPGYHRYGGRGITVCKQWLDFKQFLLDMGVKPAGLTLERDDNSKGYEPGNCRWATRTEQNRNRRSTHGEEVARVAKALHADGVSAADIGRLLAVPYGTVYDITRGVSWS